MFFVRRNFLCWLMKNFKVGNCVMSNFQTSIINVLFANDCLLFTKAKSSQAKPVKDVLNNFCLGSSLKVNIQKSTFKPRWNWVWIQGQRFPNLSLLFIFLTPNSYRNILVFLRVTMTSVTRTLVKKIKNINLSIKW